jgi:hypothetical protein
LGKRQGFPKEAAGGAVQATEASSTGAAPALAAIAARLDEVPWKKGGIEREDLLDVPKANPATDRGSSGPQSLRFSEQGDNPYNEGEPISSNAEPSGEVGKPAASPAEPAWSSINSELEALEHLVKLRDVGALTDAEFQAAKKKILGG